ncbi:MAG: SRPBCC domain-containing protein [Saprospiraceae bacterium]|nr:SRPBCC domain-containing protein [Saprospiraceae bacterium]
MKQLIFSIQINAPKEKVWNTLLDDKTYRQWTSVFHEGSYAVGDWSEGSKILFLGPEGSGMTSRIFRHVPNEFLSIQHLGTVNNGVEDFGSEETKKWSGALENYAVQEKNGVTTLNIETDTAEDFEAHMRETWPRALAKLKELTESA